MRILVTGGTGFIGQQLLPALLEAGHDIKLITRNHPHPIESLGLPVEAYRCDLMNEVPPEELLEDVHAVIHLAGESVAKGRWTRKKKNEIYESRIIGTQNLVTAINKFGTSVETLISASAIGYYADRGNESLDESATPGTGFLSKVCQAWERAAQQCSARTVCLRIGMVLGNGGALEKLLPLFKLGLGGRVGNGKQWMSWIHVEDVVRLILHSLEKKTIVGPLNAVSPYPVTNSQFTASLANSLGVSAPFPAPAWGLRIVLGEMSQLATSSQRINPNMAHKHNFSFKYPSIESACTAICPHPSKKHEQKFTFNQWLDHPVSDVFAFFANAHNLEKITPSWLNFRIQNNSNLEMGEGKKIDYQLRIRGFPVKWQSLIEKWRPNEMFIDKQTVGPYKHWLHTHKFTSIKQGTLITDQVTYEIPGGYLGALLFGSWIRADLKKIFEYRRCVISSTFAESQLMTRDTHA